MSPSTSTDASGRNKMGCLALAGGLILLSLLGVAWNALVGDGDGPQVRMTLQIDLNQNIAEQLVFYGGSCDLSEYSVRIAPGDSTAGDYTAFPLKTSWHDGGTYCHFTVVGQVPVADQYTIWIQTESVDPTIASTTIDRADVDGLNSDGDEELDILVRWTNPREAD